MITLSKGRVKSKGLKFLVYGPEGIGKSTFASRFPAPIFIDTEGSTEHMDVVRVDPAPKSWTELLEVVRQMATPQYRDGYQTLVLDTADWAEKLCSKHLCDARGYKGIEDFGYGKGYTYLEEEFGRLLNLLTDVINAGNNVVITAHAAMRKFEQPDEQGAYDRWELKLQKKTAPLVKEWADAVLFANYKTIVVNVDGQGAAKGKNKVQGGRRVMYTSHHPCWDAKNRFDLADEIPFDYEQIAHIVPERKENSTEAVHATPAPASPEPNNSPCEPPKETSSVLPAASHLPQRGRQSNSALPYGEGAPNGAGEVSAGEPCIDEPVPEDLRRLMIMNGVTAREVREVVAKVGYYPVDTPIASYEEGFVPGMIVGDWNTVYSMILQMRSESDDTPF
ncbi:MAG: ATP-binding protein [Candidatus Ventricola sp.]